MAVRYISINLNSKNKRNSISELMDGEGATAFANYKGVMMCTRPQDKTNVTIERPFCSRVTPATEIGINPNKPTIRKQPKRVLPALANHRKWLDGFKREIEHAKEIQGEMSIQEELRKIRIKQKAQETRDMIREGGPFPEVIVKSKIEKRTRPLSPKTNFKMKINEENRKLIQSMALEPGFRQEIQPENNPNNANTHQIVLPSLNKEHIQKVKFDLPEERDQEFVQPKMPPISDELAVPAETKPCCQHKQENENNTQNLTGSVPHQMVQSEPPIADADTNYIAHEMEQQEPETREIHFEEHTNNGHMSSSKNPLKKKSKPAWARTTDQQEELENEEDDELINFMGNLDFDKYVEDVEIKNLMQSLKDRVDNLKQEPDWREKWKKRLKEKTERRKQEYLKEKEQRKQDEDNMSVIASTGGDSKASFLFGGEALTVSSSKTQESINGLKQQLEDKKKGKAHWDKNVSVTSNQSDLENRIAKHIADEILRTNMAMSKIHSNQSIRRIMEQELKTQLKHQSGDMTGDGLEALNEDEMEELYL